MLCLHKETLAQAFCFSAPEVILLKGFELWRSRFLIAPSWNQRRRSASAYNLLPQQGHHQTHLGQDQGKGAATRKTRA
jgi:hypothetical protein